MIELRWFQPKPPGHGYGIDVVIPEKVLQYRHAVIKHEHDQAGWPEKLQWSDWREVPTVVESGG